MAAPSRPIFPPTLTSGARARGLADSPGTAPPPPPSTSSTPTTPPKPPATETLAQRTGALVNEIDFPKFVAGLVHGTFDAMVDAAIRQMESYSSLVTAVAKTVDQFTEENVTDNQARDWLAQRYPGDVRVQPPSGEQTVPQLVPTAEGLTPAWLAEYGAAGEELTSELLEERVVPQVRKHVGGERWQLLSTMVMLGMNRVVVKDGSINAKVMFRAAANDAAKVSYATGSDPQAVASWGDRGSLTYSGASQTMVSTLGVNAQSDTSLRADLFGEVQLNFVSETLPLDRLADAVKVSLIQRNSAVSRVATPAPTPATAASPAAPPPAAPHGGNA